MLGKPFLTTADAAQELDVSSTTVLRMIRAGTLPAILVSRIYRIPRAGFEMFKAGTLRAAGVAPVGGVKPRPRLGQGEVLPRARGPVGARAR